MVTPHGDVAVLDQPTRSGANQYDLGSFDKAVIIETIQLAGIISRTEISRRTGLTQQSVSRILRVLLQQGLLAEAAQQRAERLGKPRTPVRLESNAAHAVGIHLGGPAFEKDVADVFLFEIDRAVNSHPIARGTRTVLVEESMLQTNAAAVGAASTIFHDAFTARVGGSSQARRLPE